MVSQHNERVAAEAKQFYASQLQRELEAKHRDQFVAIEPESGDYFVADSFGQAVAAARKVHPERISFVIHIGHAAALHLGGVAR